MLTNIDLSRTVDKAEYKAAKKELELRLIALQRRVLDLKIPVIVVFEGWSAAGKGTLINELILPLDPRGFKVHSTLAPNEEERLRPFLWRFWTVTPVRGRIAIFDRSWYKCLMVDRVEGRLKRRSLQSACEDVRSFERQLVHDGCVIVKFLVHISKQEQKQRFRKLRASRATAWRVTKEDLRQHRHYGQYVAAAEEILAATDSDFAVWTVIEAHDRRFATLKVYQTVVAALERRVAEEEQKKPAAPATRSAADSSQALRVSILDKVDLAQVLDEADYRGKLQRNQERLRELEHEIYMRRVPVIVMYEGWDAAGKGGNIRRLVQNLDPRGYEVVPIGPPTEVEKAHHFLWRFWTQMPKAGHITIFDRSWYGRVLVERVEGFCREDEWRRAYREINEMELHLANFGTVLAKFWLHIDQAEQMRRFRERESVEHKQWKITDEDWRNRKQWGSYKVAVEEMLFRTSTPHAPWTIVESNCKRYARIKTMATVIDAIEKRLKR